eukprot:1161724-Pelagomonas_calceolata.AAC.11
MAAEAATSGVPKGLPMSGVGVPGGGACKSTGVQGKEARDCESMRACVGAVAAGHPRSQCS